MPSYMKNPLHGIFAFFLLIFANYLARLSPCKIQQLFNSSILLKHIFGFLTMMFFVVLVDKDHPRTIISMLGFNMLLYGIAVIMMNTHVYFFLFSLLILACLYIFNLEGNELDDITLDKKTNDLEKYNSKYNEIIHNVLYVLFFISTTIGFLIYMGEKKLEYKDKFNYIYFLFGTANCEDTPSKTNIYKSLLAVMN